jgi:hypothetical protein
MAWLGSKKSCVPFSAVTMKATQVEARINSQSAQATAGANSQCTIRGLEIKP